ncbi:unnamed protein product [Cuscuta epithymum]|uniref:Zinc finger PHD-type domain-containing protein n=1 Tax=Cuscuta epithymum TaxID=186058 RepID=A0AAV0FNT4_9ASTE|nr:unnamed protein product [Cuscuta epithymum]
MIGQSTMGTKVGELSREHTGENAMCFSGNGAFPSSKSKKDAATDPKMEVIKSIKDHGVCFAETECIDKVCSGRPGMVAPQTYRMEESDGSEVVEVDVKVCDICGDAGREHLLAICSRCTDGAEHTYCMREMIEKVPEGDWVCEECKFDEEMQNKKHAKSGKINAKEETPFQRIAIANSDHPRIIKPKTSDSGGYTAIKEHCCVRTSAKRHTDISEVSSVVKKRRLESMLGLPKAKVLNRAASLSREHSFQNIGKQKVKLINQLSYGIDLSLETKKRPPELILASSKEQIQKKDASLHRENSSKILESLPDDSKVSSVAKKQTLEPILCSPKSKIPVRAASLSRESSFKNLEMGRVKPLNTFSSGSAAVNVSSSACLQLQPQRGMLLKSNSFSSQNSKPKCELVDQVSHAKQKMSRGTEFIKSKEGAVRSLGKSMSFKSPTSTHFNGAVPKTKMLSPRFSRDHDIGLKRTQQQSAQRSKLSNCVSISSSRSDKNLLHHSDLSYSTLKDADLKSSGETKKQASHMYGVSASNRVKDYKKKPNQSSPKANFSSSTPAAKCSADKVTHGCLDEPAVKNSGEVMHESGDAKIAIETITFKKPGVPGKIKVSDHTEDLSASNKHNRVCTENQLPSSSSRSFNFSKETHVELKQLEQSVDDPLMRDPLSVTCSSEAYTNNVEKLVVLPDETPIITGHAGPPVPFDGKSSVINMQPCSSTEMASPRTIIPKQQYIWQGGFEIHRSGNFVNLYDGIQAHVSTCASPKVADVVDKFPQKLVLREISRSSSWPIQFQDHGVREENIALFFFPVDIVNYEKSYKVLLGDMMKHDLALKGKFGCIELLIFPSNQLPEKVHRWNMMYFLWGVFKGNKENNLRVCGAEKLLTQDIPRTMPPIPANFCNLGPIVNAPIDSIDIPTETLASKVLEPVSSNVREEGISSNCRVEEQHSFVPKSERVTNSAMSVQLSDKCATQPVLQRPPLHFREAPLAGMQEVVSVTSQSMRKSSHEDGVNLFSVNQDRNLKSSINGFFAHSNQTIITTPQEKPHDKSLTEAKTLSFPTSPLPVDNLERDVNVMHRKMHSVVEKDLLHNETLNLELALVTDAKCGVTPPKIQLADNAATSKVDEEVSTSLSLSLSLSFPYPEKEQGSSPPRTAAQTVAGRPGHVNTTFLLF